ncbi:MAG: alpha-amylase family protein [Candidatus Latescibacterota bacterium]
MKKQIMILYDASLPTSPPKQAVERLVAEGSADREVLVVGVDEAAEQLRQRTPQVFVTLGGEVFPKSLWLPFLAFVKGGGHWVNLGGMPFRRPAWKDPDGKWVCGTLQTRYHRTLGLMNGYAVGMDTVRGFRIPEEMTVLSGLETGFDAQGITALTVQFTHHKDEPAALGSSGPVDAEMHALLWAVDEQNRPVASPTVCIDHVRGYFAGSRWVLANFSPSSEYEGSDGWCALVRQLIRFAAEGPFVFKVRPGLACYEVGGQPSLSVHLQTWSDARADTQLTIKVTRNGKEKYAHTHPISWTGHALILEIPLPLPVESGLYVVSCELSEDGLPIRTHRTGFWGRDRALLASGATFSVDGDYFYKGDAVYPVVGTTYMAGDVHRKFLLDPNPWVWDSDFARMKADGVNMVRTGIWTLWRKVMPSPGLPNQATLRALDAYIHAARKVDIPVIFTFFAFLPETWEGDHPYLDPRSLAAQKEFLRAIVSRYKRVTGLIWDLINEPSFSTRNKLWSTRPTQGAHERTAWRKWLEDRYQKVDRLHEAWRMTPADFDDFSDVPLPEERDFGDDSMYQDRIPLRVGDYRLFTQDIFHGWVRDMAAVIREELGEETLVTVGPDEGGIQDCPSAHFFSPAVDFTCMHTWWNNDALLWDHVAAKVPGKALLIEETGMMFYEGVEGLPRRSEEACRNWLEKKFAYAFSTGSAGVIEWLWNTNCHMDCNNEVEVGSHRADLTEKPQAAVMRGFSEFLSSARGAMHGRKERAVWMVVPHGYQFSVKGAYSKEATRKSLLVLQHFNGLPVACVAEHNVGGLRGPSLVVVPSPHVLSEAAWEALVAHARSGATVLVTGAVSRDEHWRPARRLTDFDLKTEIRPVARHEALTIGDREVYFHYSGMKIEHIDKEVVIPTSEGAVEQAPKLVHVPVDAGRLVFCPLPIELSDNYGEVAAVYDAALDGIDLPPIFRRDDPDPGVLINAMEYERAILYGIISEAGSPQRVRFTQISSDTDIELLVPASRAAMLMLDRKSGQLIGAYVPEGANVKVNGRKLPAGHPISAEG